MLSLLKSKNVSLLLAVAVATSSISATFPAFAQSIPNLSDTERAQIQRSLEDSQLHLDTQLAALNALEDKLTSARIDQGLYVVESIGGLLVPAGVGALSKKQLQYVIKKADDESKIVAEMAADAVKGVYDKVQAEVKKSQATPTKPAQVLSAEMKKYYERLLKSKNPKDVAKAKEALTAVETATPEVAQIHEVEILRQKIKNELVAKYVNSLKRANERFIHKKELTGKAAAYIESAFPVEGVDGGSLYLKKLNRALERAESSSHKAALEILTNIVQNKTDRSAHGISEKFMAEESKFVATETERFAARVKGVRRVGYAVTAMGAVAGLVILVHGARHLVLTYEQKTMLEAEVKAAKEKVDTARQQVLNYQQQLGVTSAG